MHKDFIPEYHDELRFLASHYLKVAECPEFAALCILEMSESGLLGTVLEEQVVRAVVHEVSRLLDSKSKLIKTSYDLLSLPKTEWLWPNKIPRGHVTVVLGPMGSGKSALVQHWARLLSTGGTWPDGSDVKTRSKTLWIDAEGAKALIRDRMVNWKMKPEDLIFPDQEDFYADFTIYDENDILVQQILEEERPVLVVVDSLSGLHTENENKSHKMKEIMQRMRYWAAEYTCAVLVVHHPNKKHQLNSSERLDLDRSRGSSVIPASARSVLAVDMIKQEVGVVQRLYQLKNNLGPLAEDDLFFRVEDDGLHFFEPPPDSTAHLRPQMSQLEKAKMIIMQELAQGPVPSKEMERKLGEAGISEATSKRAKNALLVNSEKVGTEWFWKLEY